MTYVLESFSIKNRAQIKDYVEFPYSLYKSDSRWIPKLKMEYLGLPLLGIKGMFDERFPFHKNAKVCFFVVRLSNKIVGTVCAFLNFAYNEFHQTNTGFFGFFECIDDNQVSKLLLGGAQEWCQKEGAHTILGPFNFTYNHTCGTLIDGFESHPVIDMTYNPPYYQKLIENQGFTKAKDLLSFNLPITDKERFARLAKLSKRATQQLNISIRPINPKNLKKDIFDFVTIYNDAWKDRWAFVPIGLEEADHLAENLKLVLDPDIFLFAEVNGETIAVAGAVPDVNEVLALSKFRIFNSDILRVAKLLLRKQRVKSGRMMAFGIREDYRRKGIESLLFTQALNAASQKGYTHGDVGWVHEDNDLMVSTIKAVKGEPYKQYRIFSKALHSL